MVNKKLKFVTDKHKPELKYESVLCMCKKKQYLVCLCIPNDAFIFLTITKVKHILQRNLIQTHNALQDIKEFNASTVR